MPHKVLHGSAADAEPFGDLFQSVEFHRHMIPMRMKCSLETLPHDRGTPGWRGFFLFFVGLLNVMNCRVLLVKVELGAESVHRVGERANDQRL